MTYAIVAGLMVSGMYLLLSLGFTIMLRIADIPNMAHGVVVAGGMYLVILLVNDLNVPYAFAVPVACLLGLIPCFLLYELILRPARGEGHRPQIIFTLLVLSILQAVYEISFGGDLVALAIDAKAWGVLGVAIQREQVLGFVVATAVCAALFAFFKFTNAGKQMEIAGKYSEGAQAIGVPVERVYRQVFLMGSTMALLAGALIVSTTPASPFVGLHYLVIAVVVSIAARLSFAGCVATSLLYGVGYEILLELANNPAMATIGIFAIFIIIIAAAPNFKLLIRSTQFRKSSATGTVS